MSNPNIVISIVVVIILIITLFVYKITNPSLYRVFKSVQAVVNSVACKKNGSCEATISYLIGDKTINTSFEIKSSDEYKIGDIIQIKYNVDEPQEIVIKDNGTDYDPNTMFYMGLTILIIVLCIILYFYFSNKSDVGDAQ